MGCHVKQQRDTLILSWVLCKSPSNERKTAWNSAKYYVNTTLRRMMPSCSMALCKQPPLDYSSTPVIQICITGSVEFWIERCSTMTDSSSKCPQLARITVPFPDALVQASEIQFSSQSVSWECKTDISLMSIGSQWTRIIFTCSFCLSQCSYNSCHL